MGMASKKSLRRLLRQVSAAARKRLEAADVQPAPPRRAQQLGVMLCDRPLAWLSPPRGWRCSGRSTLCNPALGRHSARAVFTAKAVSVALKEVPAKAYGRSQPLAFDADSALYPPAAKLSSTLIMKADARL